MLNNQTIQKTCPCSQEVLELYLFKIKENLLCWLPNNPKRHLLSRKKIENPDRFRSATWCRRQCIIQSWRLCRESVVCESPVYKFFFQNQWLMNMAEELLVVLNRSESTGFGFSLLGKPGLPPIIYNILDDSPAAESGEVRECIIIIFCFV